MSAGVLIYVQHLLGIGHLKRAATLARACAEAGLEVTLVSGGGVVPGLDSGAARVLQLPPARAADESFRTLLDDSGTPVDAAWEARRRALLLASFAAASPNVLVLEMFPFGRRRLAFELMPLIEAAAATRPAVSIVCSVRDILVRKRKPGRDEHTAELIETWFDHVLVHGDPGLVRLDRTFPLAPRIADRIHYTGYVAEPAPARGAATGAGAGEVIVSAGGGAVGGRLLACALEARSQTTLEGAPWRLLAGANLDHDRFAALVEQAPRGVTVERARADFPALLANCRLSISQAGYNTVASVVRAGVRSVLVPFAGGGENEQELRAELLRGRGAVQVVAESALEPRTLAAAVDAAAHGPPASAAGIDLSGAETSARLIVDWARASPLAIAGGGD
ncbi:MAG: glycosyltransferase [Alphaproteobacteria bacterium]|nr:glycosyltransferase [Alphaproteobacteria bacterium]